MSFLLLCAGSHRGMDAAGICWWASIPVSRHSAFLVSLQLWRASMSYT